MGFTHLSARRSLKYQVAFGLLAVFLAGCQDAKYTPLEAVPGLSEDRRGRSAILNEGDHCFITEVDGHEVGPPDGDEIQISSNTVLYRQFEVPPGTHAIVVKYYCRSGTGSDTAGPARITVELDDKHDYSLKSQIRAGVYSPVNFSFGPIASAAWRPILIDSDTHQLAVVPGK